MCKKKTGTVVKCEDCHRLVHVSCAWTAGYKFAFEVQTVTNRRKKTKDVPVVKFKEDEGALRLVGCVRDRKRADKSL